MKILSHYSLFYLAIKLHGFEVCIVMLGSWRADVDGSEITYVIHNIL